MTPAQKATNKATKALMAARLDWWEAFWLCGKRNIRRRAKREAKRAFRRTFNRHVIEVE